MRGTSVHGGYGIYYDRITLEIESLERGLDGRALPIEVRAGNVFFLDPATGTLAAVRADARRIRSPGSSCPARARRASTSSTTHLQNPTVQQFDARRRAADRRRSACASTACTTSGTDFLIGRTVGEVFNPVVGGPDRVVNIESSARTQLRRAARRASSGASARVASCRVAYTLAKAMNYANDDQIPF